MTGPGATLSDTAEDLREYFLLREAERRAGAIEESKRPDFERRAEVARQKREAAEALWANGSPAEALLLARDAATQVCAAARETGVTLSADQLALEKSATERDLPALDSEVSEEHAKLFRQWIELHHELDGSVAPVVVDRKTRARMRVSRMATLAAIAIGLLALLVYFIRRPVPVGTQASASWSARFSPENVVDGVDTTEWLLPDNTGGWIDFTFPSPRSLSVVKLQNGTNKGEPIRAINEFELEIWADNKLLKKVPGSLGPYAPAPPVRPFALGVGEKVTRVRLVVKTWFGSGGALAEASFE